MTTPSRRTPIAFVVAAVLGLLHAASSLYWGLGGRWLLSTLGERIVALMADLRWVLLPVALVKAGFAAFPWLCHRGGWPWRVVTRALSWLGAALLVGWGGVNTVTGNLVTLGVLHPESYDRPGMIGHAWLWDPLFLLWGLAVAVGLWATRRVTASAGSGR